VHPIVVLGDVAAEIADAATDAEEGPRFFITQLAANVYGWLACTFSFPNQGTDTVIDWSESKNANVLTCLTCALRILEEAVASMLIIFVTKNPSASKIYAGFKA
jgi:hypothetical protein